MTPASSCLRIDGHVEAVFHAPPRDGARVPLRPSLRHPAGGPYDDAFSEHFRHKMVLVFDEDVAEGRALRAFADIFGPRFAETRTASALRHYLAPFVPDDVGHTFYDE